MMIRALDAIRAINQYRGESVVVSTPKTASEWAEISNRRDLDINLMDCVDKVSALGLGVSIARPDVRILVIDSDASLRTNPASLVTVGTSCPNNMIHFLLEDCGHSSTGGVPIPRLDSVDFQTLARGAGYTTVISFQDLEEMTLSLPDLLGSEGPIFILLKVWFDFGVRSRAVSSTAESLRYVKQRLQGTRVSSIGLSD